MRSISSAYSRPYFQQNFQQLSSPIGFNAAPVDAFMSTRQNMPIHFGAKTTGERFAILLGAGLVVLAGAGLIAQNSSPDVDTAPNHGAVTQTVNGTGENDTSAPAPSARQSQKPSPPPTPAEVTTEEPPTQTGPWSTNWIVAGQSMPVTHPDVQKAKHLLVVLTTDMGNVCQVYPIAQNNVDIQVENEERKGFTVSVSWPDQTIDNPSKARVFTAPNTKANRDLLQNDCGAIIGKWHELKQGDVWPLQ